MKDARITHPDDDGHPDGLQWLMLGEEAKFAYVLGFVEGLFRGHCFTTWGLPDSKSNTDYLDATRSFNEHWTRFVSKLKYSEFVGELDKFYADEKNSRIEIQHGLWIAMNILAGISDENLASMVEAWRQKDSGSV
jgi:hypothetical protein